MANLRHLSFQQIVSHLEGAASFPHLEGCERCSLEAERVALMLGTLRSDSSAEPSSAALQRAHMLFPDRTAPVSTLTERLVRWVAALGFDSAMQLPALAGARGAGVESRQMLYSTNLVDLDLSYGFQEPPLSLRGQALPRDETQPHLASLRNVILVRDGEEPVLSMTDEHGSFVFNGLAEGRYQLELELDDGTVEASFELQRRPPE